MNPSAREELRRDAARYIWWERPDEALRRPNRIIAQVMDIGDFEDVRRMASALGLDKMRGVLLHAEAGWFNERSWSYWCYRLGVVKPGDPLPPMPRRMA